MAAAALLLYPASLAARIYLQTRTDEVHRADAIVVLGAAQYDGRPSPVFAARLRHAAYLYREGLAPLVFVTGGRRPGDRFSEAEAGAAYLVRHGVPRHAVVLEDRGDSTLESLQRVASLADGRGVDTVLLVSDPLHSERVKTIATDLGFERAWASWASYQELGRSRLTKLKELLREVAALGVYELLGR